METKIEITKLKCNRCGYEWFPRSPNLPAVCPACKSRCWSQPKKESVEE